jgi:formylglycine-generating enzyme required for sulfatase activity
MWSTKIIPAFLILSSISFLVIGGCKDEDSPAAPAPSETGTIEIDATPDAINAPWTITGPSSYNTSGTGDQTLASLNTGSYTLIWGGAAGWIAPANDTQTLAANATLTFSGTYVEDPGPGAGFLPVPAGTFTMGSPETELDHRDEELQHSVTLTMPFHLAAMEVTNQQYADLAQWALDAGYCTATDVEVSDALDGSTEVLLGLDDPAGNITFNAGTFSVVAGRENYPVKNVTWYGAAAYCDWLSLQAGIVPAYDHDTWLCNGGDPYGAQGFRLPTEAEWEYACRAGSVTAFANGEITSEGCYDPVLDEIGWHCGNSNDLAQPVGQKSPNNWGFYDMHGNAWEWCHDWVNPYTGDVTDPVGDTVTGNRATRGGNWRTYAKFCRSARRTGYRPDFRTDGYNVNVFGIRPARSTH